MNIENYRWRWLSMCSAHKHYLTVVQWEPSPALGMAPLRQCTLVGWIRGCLAPKTIAWLIFFRGPIKQQVCDNQS